jgi:hypothetical protein
VQEYYGSVDEGLKEINDQVHEEFEMEIEKLTNQWSEIENALDQWLDDARDVWQAITQKLAEETTEVDQFEVDFTVENEVPPLFDSSRTYLEQNRFYRRHKRGLIKRAE